IEAVKKDGFVEEGDTVVITSGVPLGEPGSTNMVHVRTVGEILGKGDSLIKRIENGAVCKASNAEEAIRKIQKGDILVVKSASRDYLPAIKLAAAVITEKGGLSSYAGLATLNFDTVSVLGVSGIYDILSDGMVVTADGVRGLIYKGRIA
ncbi:MAG: PEP-utilizing enzyme, partial [Synergistaceae bacterium]